MAFLVKRALGFTFITAYTTITGFGNRSRQGQVSTTSPLTNDPPPLNRTQGRLTEMPDLGTRIKHVMWSDDISRMFVLMLHSPPADK